MGHEAWEERFATACLMLMPHASCLLHFLSRLRAEEYLKTSIEESPGGPPRKYYELTERGRAQLRRMNAHWTQLQDALERLRKERR